MADAGDLKSPARIGRVGSNPTSAIDCDLLISSSWVLQCHELKVANRKQGQLDRMVNDVMESNNGR